MSGHDGHDVGAGRVLRWFVRRDQYGYEQHSVAVDGRRVAQIEGTDQTWSVLYAGGGIVLPTLHEATAWIERHADAVAAGEPIPE